MYIDNNFWRIHSIVREKGFKFSEGDPWEYKIEYDLLAAEGLSDDTTLESGSKVDGINQEITAE